MKKKPKLLCILHYAPPAHGASKVGDSIKESKKLNSEFECRFIKIRSSETIGDIGEISFKKFYYVAELYIKVLLTLLIFRPQIIYYTASIKSIAFYRDLLISTLWKVYRVFKSTKIFYHYHTKGIDAFASSSRLNLLLTRFFLNDVNLILLSPILENDYKKVQTYKKVFYLPNGVNNPMTEKDFQEYVTSKYVETNTIEILYLSNMIKSKGYFSVLELARRTKNKPIKYNFAGGWQKSEDEREFYDYINDNSLDENVRFHGFVNGLQKRELFQKAHLFLFPTRYKNEAFPLSILESLSYGVPVIATDEGSIPYMFDRKSGIIIGYKTELLNALDDGIEKLVNEGSAQYCRMHYLKHFSLNQFENNLVRTLKE